jgi:hypothetical protein
MFKDILVVLEGNPAAAEFALSFAGSRNEPAAREDARGGPGATTINNRRERCWVHHCANSDSNS